MKKKKKKKKITGIKIILEWLRSSIDQALTIAVWVVVWSIVDPYICELSMPFKFLIVLVLIIVLQRDVARNMRKWGR